MKGKTAPRKVTRKRGTSLAKVNVTRGSIKRPAPGARAPQPHPSPATAAATNSSSPEKSPILKESDAEGANRAYGTTQYTDPFHACCIKDCCRVTIDYLKQNLGKLTPEQRWELVEPALTSLVDPGGPEATTVADLAFSLSELAPEDYMSWARARMQRGILQTILATPFFPRVALAITMVLRPYYIMDLGLENSEDLTLLDFALSTLVAYAMAMEEAKTGLGMNSYGKRDDRLVSQFVTVSPKSQKLLEQFHQAMNTLGQRRRSGLNTRHEGSTAVNAV